MIHIQSKIGMAIASYAVLASVASGGQPFELSLVAKTGDTPPNRPGAMFDAFSNPSINNLGDIAFEALYIGASSNEGVYRHSVGTLLRVVDDGFDMHPPGQGGATTWSGFGPPVINDASAVLFGGNFSFGDGNLGVYRFPAAASSAVILDNNPTTPVPGQPDANGFNMFPFSSGIASSLNESGQTVFTAHFFDQSFVDRVGIYTGASLQTVVRIADQTMPPPAQAGSARFGAFSFFPALNDAGDVAFQSTYTGGIGTSGLYLFLASNKTVTRLADSSIAPPDQPGAARYTQVDTFPSINNNGSVAFLSRYVSGAGNQGIFIAPPSGSIKTVVNNSGAFIVPGHPGTNFQLFGSPVVNSADDVVFSATFGAATSDAALYLSRNDSLVSVVDFSDSPPGQPGASFTFLGSYSINQSGHVVFTARYSNGIGNEGIYFFDGVDLIRITDESLPLDGELPSNLDLTLGLGGAGGEDAKASPINDNDEVVFIASFPSGAQRVFRATRSLTPGDINGDGVVNGADLAALLTQWATNGSADLNNDSIVNGADLAILLTNWG